MADMTWTGANPQWSDVLSYYNSSLPSTFKTTDFGYTPDSYWGNGDTAQLIPGSYGFTGSIQNNINPNNLMVNKGTNGSPDSLLAKINDNTGAIFNLMPDASGTLIPTFGGYSSMNTNGNMFTDAFSDPFMGAGIMAVLTAGLGSGMGWWNNPATSAGTAAGDIGNGLFVGEEAASPALQSGLSNGLWDALPAGMTPNAETTAMENWAGVDVPVGTDWSGYIPPSGIPTGETMQGNPNYFTTVPTTVPTPVSTTPGGTTKVPIPGIPSTGSSSSGGGLNLGSLGNMDLGTLLAALYGINQNQSNAADLRSYIDQATNRMSPIYNEMKANLLDPTSYFNSPEFKALDTIDTNKLVRTDSARGGLSNDTARQVALQNYRYQHLNDYRNSLQSAYKNTQDPVTNLSNMYMLAAMLKNGQYNPLLNAMGNNGVNSGSTGINLGNIGSWLTNLFGGSSEAPTQAGDYVMDPGSGDVWDFANNDWLP